MKSLSLGIVLLFFVCISNNSLSQNSTCIVNKVAGFYIFVDSEPIGEYEVIGEVDSEGSIKDIDVKKSGGQYQPVRDFLIKKARQVNYTADGLLISLVNGGTDKAVIIKFKDKQIDKNHARAKQYQGVYIFVDSEPLTPTKYLGTIKSRLTFSSAQYTKLRDKLLRKCKDDYADASGLIIKFVNGGTDTGDAIIFIK